MSDFSIPQPVDPIQHLDRIPEMRTKAEYRRWGAEGKRRCARGHATTVAAFQRRKTDAIGSPGSNACGISAGPGGNIALRGNPEQASVARVAVPNASNQPDERALRLHRLKQDIRQRLRNVISDWPEDAQSAVVEKIAESEMLYTDAFLRRTRARLSPIDGISRPIPEPQPMLGWENKHKSRLE
jgi:hypothetical protein